LYMPSFYRNLLLVLTVFSLVCVVAQGEVLTLNDCIELALKNNQNVIEARNQAKLSRADVWQAFGAFLPSVYVSASVRETNKDPFEESYIILDTLTIPGDTLFDTVLAEFGGDISKNYTLLGNARWELFNGGRNIFNYLGAKSLRRLYSNLEEKSEQDVIYQVKVMYFAYLTAIKKAKIAEEAVKRGEEQFKLAESRYEVGSSSKSDVLKAKVQYGNDKLGLISANNQAKVAKANLAYFIGLDVNSSVEYSSEYTVGEYAGSENDAWKFGLANHPGLLAAEQSMSASRHFLHSAYGRYLPTLSVDVSRSWVNGYWGNVNDFSPRDGAWTIGTSLSLSIFDGFSRRRNLSAAKISLSNAKSDYYYTRNRVALDIKEAYLEIAKAKEALNVAEENVLAAREDMSLVQEKYNLGAATMLELLDAQVSLVSAENSKIEADFDYNLAIAKLENAMGVR